MLDRMLFVFASIQTVKKIVLILFFLRVCVGERLWLIYIFCFVSFRFGDNVKILHFIGQLKPWVINFDPVSKKANAPQEYTHLTEYLDLWWSIFCNDVHPKLVTDMVSDDKSFPISKSNSNWKSPSVLLSLYDKYPKTNH